MQWNLTGRRFVITGAASGIARATALLLATEQTRLVLVDLNAEGLAKTVADCRAAGVT